MKRMLLLLTCATLCCGPKTTPITPSVDDMCKSAQEKLLSLQCMDEGRLLGGPNKHGIPFAQTCKDYVDKGVLTQKYIQCLSTITDCKQVDTLCPTGG